MEGDTGVFLGAVDAVKARASRCEPLHQSPVIAFDLVRIPHHAAAFEGKNGSGLTHEQWGQRQLVLSGHVHVRSSDDAPSPTKHWNDLGGVGGWCGSGSLSWLPPTSFIFPPLREAPSRSPHFCVRDSEGRFPFSLSSTRLTPRLLETLLKPHPAGPFSPRCVLRAHKCARFLVQHRRACPRSPTPPKAPCRVSPPCSFTVYLPSCKALRCSQHSANCPVSHPPSPTRARPSNREAKCKLDKALTAHGHLREVLPEVRPHSAPWGDLCLG